MDRRGLGIVLVLVAVVVGGCIDGADGADETRTVPISAACLPESEQPGTPLELRVFDTCGTPCEEKVRTRCDVQMVGDRVEVRASADVVLHEMCEAVCELVEVSCELPDLEPGSHEIVFPENVDLASITIEVGALPDPPACRGDLEDEECAEVCGAP